MLDLDGFKDVNDRFGHLAGNKVLQMIAEGLRNACRECDWWRAWAATNSW